jgi:hypothetical protein
MDDVLSNPAFQAGLAPFLCALVVAVVLRKSHLVGLALAAAFFAVVGLTVGYSFGVLTAVRKLVIVALCFTALVAWLPSPLAVSAAGRTALGIAAALAGIWVAWRIIEQRPGPGSSGLLGAAVAAYLMMLMESTLRAATRPNAAAAISLVQGTTAGLLCVLGASALLAQFGVAIAVASAALLLVQLVGAKGGASGWLAGTLSALTLGIVDLLAVLTGSLPWYCLLPTLAVPWTMAVLPANSWRTTLLGVLAAAVPGAAAVALAWFGIAPGA